MKRALFSVLIAILVSIFTLPAIAFAQIANHDLVPPVTISKPDVGKTIVEPSFDTSLTRLTNANREGQQGIFAGNSRRQAWNIDESLMLLSSGNGSTMLYDGQTYQFKKVLTDLKGEDIFWHPTDPFLVIYSLGNSLRSYNVITNEVKVIHSFSDYTSITSSGQGNISIDGRYYAFLGLNTKFPNLGFTTMVVFDIWKDEIVAKKTFYNKLAEFDGISVSPKGSYVVVNYVARMNTDFRGMEVYDRNLNLIWSKPLWRTSYDLGIDANGDEVLVVDRYEVQTNSNFIEKHRLSDGQMVVLLEHSPYFYTNISCQNLAPSAHAGWCVVTTYDNESRLTDSVESWLPFEDEILLVNMDGSQDVRRLAHHRSRRYSPTTPFEDYSIAFAEPNATISRNGDRILFASNWLERVGLASSVDTYLIDMRDSATLRDFRIETSASEVIATPGDVVGLNIDIKSMGEFTDTVGLDISVSPNPENFKVFFTVPDVRSEKTKVGIMVMKEAAFGNYLLHITGRNGNIVHHAGVLVEVGRKLESFHVRLQPSTMFVKRGEDFNVMVMIERNSGFSEGVTVWTMGTKALKIKVTPGVVSDVDAMTPFNLKTTKKTPLGTHKIMFVAKANSGRVETVTMNLTVTE